MQRYASIPKIIFTAFCIFFSNLTNSAEMNYSALDCFNCACAFAKEQNKKEYTLKQKVCQQEKSRYKKGLALTSGIEIGNKKNIFNLGATIPLIGNQNNIIFFDGDVKTYNIETQEFSFGVGFRKNKSNGILVGTNIFHDIRVLPNHTFHQNSFGFELFLKSLEFRANYYIPNKKYSFIAVNKIDTEKNTAFVEKEIALGGFDIEAGLHGKNFSIYCGMYRFSNNFTEIQGGKLRGEALINLNSRFGLLLGWEMFKDNARGVNYAAKASFKIPIGMYYGSILQPVIRDRDIITAKKETEEKIDKIVLKADQNYEFKKVIEINQPRDIRDNADDDLLYAKSNLALDKSYQSLSIIGGADLEIYTLESQTKKLPYTIGNKNTEIIIKSGGVDNGLIAGAKVKFDNKENYDAKNLTFFDATIENTQNNNSFTFKKDNNIKIISSIINDNYTRKKPLFYSNEEVTYTLRDVNINTINNLQTLPIFGSDTNTRSYVKLGRKIAITKK